MFGSSWSGDILDAIQSFFFFETADELLRHGWLFVDIAHNIIMAFCIVFPFFIFYVLFRLFFK